MWNYTTDSGRLADAVGDEALSLAIKYNSIMSLLSGDYLQAMQQYLDTGFLGKLPEEAEK